MPEFAWPWVFIALPLPWLAAGWLRPGEAAGAALKMPGLIGWDARAMQSASRRVAPMFWLIWVLLCLAAARPQWLGEPVSPPQAGRDLLLAVDLSGSMAEEDMRLGGRRVDRLTAAKAVLSDFLDRRRGDRVGLIVFGRQAYSLVPLTVDLESVRQQLLDTMVGMAGRETAIGDAVALAVKRMRERPESQRVLILLTDGVNTAGTLSPERALELARGEQVRIHTIGFGASASGGFLGITGPTGDGIDEAMLNRLAVETGGRYFRATNTAELAGIYQAIDAIEAIEAETLPVRPRFELYPWPLAGALLLWLVWPIAGFVSGRREQAT